MVDLVDVSTVRTRLKLPDAIEVDQAIANAITASTPLLEAKLATVFSKRSVTDTFFVSESHPRHHGYFVLKLSSGLVRASPSITVFTGSSLQLIATPLDLTETLLKSELGHLYIPDSYAGLFVTVAYESGYAYGETVVDWLQEAALMHAISMLSVQQIGDNSPDISKALDFMRESSTTILDAHIRSRSYTISPF